MQFRQLEYLVAVARERNFARAAESCYVSQPALSVAIAKLERELDVTLIIRSHAFGGLTPEGERVVLWAKRVLAEHDGLKAEARAVRSGVTGTLRLGTGPMVAAAMPLVAAAFCAAHPLARVRAFTQRTATEMYRQLREFELDAAIGHFGPDRREGLDVVPLYEARYVLIAPPGLLPTDADSVPWTEAAQLPLVLPAPNMWIRQVIDKAFGENGLVVTPQVETDSVGSMYASVATGSWASIVPYTWLCTLLVDRVRMVALVHPSLRTQVFVATNAASPGSPIARAFAAVSASLSFDERFAPPVGVAADA